jgi:hypothetical protein
MSQPKNFNGTTPAAPAGTKNVTFQADAVSTDPSVVRNVSAYLPAATATVAGAVPTPPNDVTKFLRGDGTWATAGAATLASDTDVTLTSPAANDGLVYNGSKWVNKQINSAVGGGYGYYRSITIDHTKVAANQSNFPVLLDLTYADLATLAHSGLVQNSNGYDIIFCTTTSSGTILSFEVESYDSTAGHIIAHVKIPSLSSTVDTVIYVLFGNSAITVTQANPTAVWDSNYKQVTHLGEASGAAISDSTSNAAGSTSNANNTQVTGPWGKAQSFNGSSSRVDFPAPFSSTSPFTFSCWFKSASAGNYGILSDARNSSAQGFLLYALTSSGLSAIYQNSIASIASFNSAVNIEDNAWHYCVGTWDGTTVTLYTDNATPSTASEPNAMNTWGPTLRIGRDCTGAFYPGINKELRVSKIVRSSSWISTEYKNQNSPSTFYTVGAETVLPTTTTYILGIVIPAYANNAAAVAGGLGIGNFYRTGSDPDTLCIVH